MMFLSGLFASAATYNVKIDDFDFDIGNYDLNVDITSQIGDLLQTGDKVIVTVDGYFNYRVYVTLNCIADNSEAASYWKMLSNFESADLGSATVGTKFSESYEFTLIEDAVTTDKYIVQVSIGFSSMLEKKQCQENGGIVTLRPTDEPDPEGETYTIDITSTVFSNDGNGSNYMAQFPFVTESTTLKKNDKVVVTLDGSFSQDMNGINFMIFDGNGNVVMAWTAKSLYAPANEPVKTSYEFNIKNNCSTETYQLGVFVEGYDENVILKFTTADDAQYVKVFSLPYNVYGERVDDDNISDQWSTKNSVEYNLELTNAVFEETGNTSWSPSVGEKFVVTMSGAANFSGTMKVRIVDTREAVSYWGELTSSNIEETTVSEGEDFSIEKVLTIIKDTKNGVSLTSPQLYIECFPTLTSTMEGFDNTKVMKLNLTDYSVAYQAAPTFAKVLETDYNEYSSDRDGDGEKDDWQGAFEQEFVAATGTSNYTPNFGDSFSLKMKGFANFSGEMAFYMVDESPEALYWLSFTADSDPIRVQEGEEYTIERDFVVSRLEKDGYTLKNPHFVIVCYPDLTSSMYGFTVDKKTFYATEYSMEYTPTTFIKTLDLSYNYYGKDTDGDNISDEWQGKYPNEFLNAVVEANGNTEWTPSLGEKFTITLEGFADFTGDLSFDMIDTRSEVGYWAEFADYGDSFRVKKGTTFTIQRVIEVAYLDKLGIALQDPYFVIGCEADVTSTKSNFDEGQIKHLYLTKYSIEYEGASQNTDEYEYLGGPMSVHGSFYTADNGVQTKVQLGEDGSQVLFCLGFDDNGYYIMSGSESMSEIVRSQAAETRFAYMSSADEEEFHNLGYFDFSKTKLPIVKGDVYAFENKNAKGFFKVADIKNSTQDVGVEVYMEAGTGEDFSGDFAYLGGAKSAQGGFYTADKGVQTKVQLGEDASQVVFCLYMTDDNPSVISGTEAANAIVSSQASETKFALMANANMETYNNLSLANFTATSVDIEENKVYAFSNKNASGFFKVGTIDYETSTVSILVYTEAEPVKIFETSYVDWEGADDVDHDGISDRWEEKFDEFIPIAHEMGYENWQPALGDKFTLKMSGTADFTGYVQLYMADVRQEVGYFEEFSKNIERFNVKQGERFEIVREFVVKSVEVDGVAMKDPQLFMICIGKPTSSQEGFNNTTKKTLSLTKYELTYTPQKKVFVGTWDSYENNDSDFDGISDLWNGNSKEFVSYKNLQEGDSFTIKMSGTSDFTGDVRFWMIDWGENGYTWTQVAKNSFSSAVTKDADYNFEWTFAVTKVEEDDRVLQPVLHYQFMPTVTSSMEGFDNTVTKNLDVTTFSIVYNKREKAIGSDVKQIVHALDTIALYLPNSAIVASTYGESGTMKYTVSCDDANFPMSFSGDTLYIMPPIDYVGQSVNISVTGTIANGGSAKGALTAVVERDSIVPNPQIALVTVSGTSGKNLVVWQKFDTDKIDHYNIYRESDETDVFTKIAEVPYSETSVYEDLEANPMVQSWRYKISATPVDSRYTETDLSDAHRTLHLQQNEGLQKVKNLYWNAYEGFKYSTYLIIRRSEVRSVVTLDTIATIASNLNTYTDTLPAKGTQAYYVAIKLPQTIDPNVLLKSENGPFSLAISNIAEVESDPTAVANVIDEKVEIRVTGRVITILNAENGAKVYDVSGRFVAASDVAPVQQVEVAKAGVYFVKIGDNVFKVVLN